MIQRIQTIYLLAATALMSIFIFSPLATFASDSDIFTLSVMGISSVNEGNVLSTLYLVIIASLATLLPLVNIFLFKNRMLQIRLCVVQIVLALGMLIVAGVYYFLSIRSFASGAGDDATLRIVCALPVVAVIFDYLALKAIFKDELLIKSLDRIR